MPVVMNSSKNVSRNGEDAFTCKADRPGRWPLCMATRFKT